MGLDEARRDLRECLRMMATMTDGASHGEVNRGRRRGANRPSEWREGQERQACTPVD